MASRLPNDGEDYVELKDILGFIATQNVQFVDFKVVDLWGKWRHVTMPATASLKQPSTRA